MLFRSRFNKVTWYASFRGKRSKLLNELGAQKNEETLEIIQNMMIFSIPTDKKKVQEMLNLQSKVESLMNLKETDHVFIIKNPMEENSFRSRPGRSLERGPGICRTTRQS